MDVWKMERKKEEKEGGKNGYQILYICPAPGGDLSLSAKKLE